MRYLETLYQTWKDRAEFLFIAIREAGHAIPVLENIDVGMDPHCDILHQRRYHNRKAMDILRLTMPGLIDTSDVESAFQAYPMRLVVLDGEGRIALDAGVGIPDGWNLVEVEDWLKNRVTR